MKIVVFNGSPKGEQGNTHRMVKEFAEGARRAGAEVANVFLSEKNIQPCRGCFYCWIKTPGRCVSEDDMAGLLAEMKTADMIVFATPVYVDNVTGLMKNFLDRCVPQADPRFEKDENGESRHLSSPGVKVPKIAVISNCGFPEQTHFQVLSHYFRRVARNMNSEVVSEIYRGGGEILGARSLWLAFPLARYKRLLRRAGREVAEAGRLSEKTRADLEKPLISDRQYIDYANRYWDTLHPAKKTGDECGRS